MNKKKKTLLKEADIFSTFLEDELDLIAENSSYISLKKGDVLFKPGDPSDTLYIVSDGEMSIVKIGENEREVEIARFMQRHCFGELSFLTHSPRNAFARSETDATLLSFPQAGKSFEEILKSHPAISARILHHLLVMVAGRIRMANSMIKENSPVIRELKKQVYLDKMTGIYNRTYMEERLKTLLANSTAPLSYISVKPDNFKEINDTYGHEAGDEAIRLFAQEMKKIVKDEESLSRYMGNEMTVVLPDADRAQALEYATMLRDEIYKMSFSEVTKGNPFIFTISIGISVFPEHSSDMTELVSMSRELTLISRSRGGGLILFPEDKNDAA